MDPRAASCQPLTGDAHCQSDGASRRRLSELVDNVRTEIDAIVPPRWHILRLLPTAGFGLVAATALVNTVLGLLPVVFLVTTSLVLGRVPAAVQSGLHSPAWDDLVAMLAVAGAALVGQQVLGPVQTALNERITLRVDGRVIRRMMAASLRVPGLAAIEDPAVRNDLADAGRELETNTQSPGRACAGLLALLARYVQLLGCVAGVGVWFSWWAAAALFLAVVLFRCGQRGGLRKYAAVFPRLAAVRRFSDYLRELASGVPAGKEIRVFGLVDWLSHRYRKVYLSWVSPLSVERRRIYLTRFLWVTALAVALVVAVMVALGADASSAGTAELTAFALTAQAILAAVRLGDYYPESDVPTQFGMNAYDAVRRLENKMARYDTTPSLPRATLPARIGTIRFQDVSFRYPGHERLVLDGLDLTIAAGRCTALVGLNGAGKTTLVKLLAKLYEPTKGAILVDDIDLRLVSARQWRRQLGIVFQDYLRYETSAADNIGFGSVEHLDDRAGIAAAAHAAGVGDVLSRLPRALDTPLARHLGGVDLSGGQWQRVAIARALFALRHGASVLVLDEPTASLDVRAEARFYDEFMRLAKGVTTLLISHRFATIRKADHIVVLADGRVLEQGSHDELMRLGGQYAELFRLQAERFWDGVDEVDTEASGVGGEDSA